MPEGSQQGLRGPLARPLRIIVALVVLGAATLVAALWLRGRAGAAAEEATRRQNQGKIEKIREKSEKSGDTEIRGKSGQNQGTPL